MRQAGNPDRLTGRITGTPATIAVRRSVRSRRLGSTSGRCSTLPSARSCHGTSGGDLLLRLCRGETKAPFPDGVISAVQDGEWIKAAAIYFNVQQLNPEIALAPSDLFGALICPASLVVWAGKKACLQIFGDRAASFVSAIEGEGQARSRVQRARRRGEGS